MKPVYLLLILFLTFRLNLGAEEVKTLPDFAKAFPQEKLLLQSKVAGIETYGYATNLPFKDIKKLFIEFLGNGWVEPETNPEVEEATSEMIEQQGMTLEGNVLFSNSAYAEVQIGLTQMKMDLDGKQFLVNITVLGIKQSE